jgi:hypothetical protein
MKSYTIEEIYGDGYERWARIKLESSNERVYVHFIEYDEYLENTSIPVKRKKDDILNGNIKIDLVTEFRVVNDGRAGFSQSINNSSDITAIGKVKEIEDSNIIICSITGLGDEIIVEFENEIVTEVNTTIEVNGSLELEIE